MPSVRVKKAFVHKGVTVEPGTILEVPAHAIEVLGNYAELVTQMDKVLMEQSKDFGRFCLAHESTYPGGHCPVKRSKQDSLTNCVGWQLKQGKKVIH